MTPFREAFTEAPIILANGMTAQDPTVGAPKGLAIRPDGKFLYAVNSLDSTIATFGIDATTGKLSPEVAPPRSFVQPPLGLSERIALDAAGNFAYVTNNTGGPVPGTVSVFALDPTTGIPTRTNTVAAGIFPRGVAVHPTGGAVYVTNFLGGPLPNNPLGTVTVFSAGGGNLVSLGHVKTGNLPLGVAVPPNGKFVYVVNNADMTVSQFAVGGTAGLTPLNPPTAA